MLNAHRVLYVVIGGVAATFHGSPLMTRDSDICPARDDDNLARLASALRAMGARIRAADVPDGLPFACDATFFARMELVNLTTRFGDLDVSFEPSGTDGYADLVRRSVVFELDSGVRAPVAALEDVIRSKEAADREKDRLTLPSLRLLLERQRREGRS